MGIKIKLGTPPTINGINKNVSISLRFETDIVIPIMIKVGTPKKRVKIIKNFYSVKSFENIFLIAPNKKY
jgi:hypothetical protein